MFVPMKIFAAFAAALICALACAAEKTIDASSDERLQETFFDALSSLDEASQQKFASSMATIGVILAQKYGEAAAHAKYAELVGGKTPAEIIKISESLAPQIRGMAERVDGKSAESFEKSVGQILIALPLAKQKSFSAAVAKIMYDAEKNRKGEPSPYMRFDAMTADELIAAARPIKTPFSEAESGEIYASPLTKEELKKRNLPEKNKEGEKTPLSTSLVPR